LQLSKMDGSHKRSSPSHISLILKTDANLAVAEPIKTIAGVAGVDTLTQFTVRFKTANNPQWQTGTAIVRPDYRVQHYDVMTLLSGQFPHDKALAVERLSAKAAGLKSGDSLVFETETGEQAFSVDGIIRHPFVKPPPFGGQLHFFISPESAAVFGIAPNTFRQLLVQVTQPYSEEKARLIAGEIRTNTARLGIGVNATLLQNPEQHWGRPFFSGINLILTVMAWASLALSSVLILNTIAALITQQTDQIGIMKSLGARRLTIARIYLTEVFIVALLALLLAVPLSLAGAYFSSQWLLNLFNIEMDGFEYSARTLYLMIAGGLLAPLLASLYPIWRGASLSVRQAIASYGLGADFGSSRFDNWLEGKVFSALPTLYAVTLGNLFRRKARLLWTQIVLIIAGVLFIIIISLITSVNLTLDNELARSKYNVRLGFSSDQPSALVEELIRTVPQTTGLELWNRLPAELSRNNVLLKQAGSLGVQIVALPVESVMYKPLIVAGRWFEHNDNEQKVLVLNAATAELNGIQVGDSINMNLLGQFNSEWQVIGLYRWFAGSGYAVEPVYAPLSTIQTFTQRKQYSSFALLSANVTTLEEEKTYADALKQAFQNQHIKLDFYTTIAKLEQRHYAKNQFRPITSMLLGLASLIASVGAIGLSGTLAIGVLQRTREIGVLRAIGASSSAIFKLFMLEGFFHGLMAWLISIPIAYFSAEPLSRKLGEIMLGIQLDFSFSWLAVWLWLAIVTVLVLLASYLPARHATRIVVRASLNY
ncbi:MAG: ABC transporter permease, partial [Methylococcaceae bacterium]|nr:ABC transporter permease [Methylococcaceae bacterium]